jgi:serine/threonine protein kinase
MTRPYASLEQLNEEDAHRSFDIWALGITLYNLMAKRLPYAQKGILKLNEAIKNSSRDKLSGNYSQ